MKFETYSYRKRSRCLQCIGGCCLCDQLRQEELAKKGKTDEEKEFLGDFDQAIGALESLGPGDL